MLPPPGFYFVKKTKRFVILSADKSSERNLSCFFDIIKPRRIEHLQKEEPFSSDPYFRYFDDLKSVHCPQKVISRLSFKVSKVLALNSLFAKVARGKNAFLHVRFCEIFFANCHARAHAR